MTFGERLAGAFGERGRLCVGIDPHAGLLAAWGLPDSAAGLREFGLRVVDAASGRAGIVKPQVAFFERHGAAGYAALEQVIVAARTAGLIVIADAKRGDIGTSVDAYGAAWLTPGAPLEADAMTAVAYQGLGSLDGVLARAAGAGKGVFVLAATSNPEGVATQTAVRGDGRRVAQAVADEVSARNRSALGDAPAGTLGPYGVVLGATVSLAEFGLEAGALHATPVLAPGFGAQGARIRDLPALFGAAASRTIVAVSRSVLSAGPESLADAISAASREAAECLA